jgi:RimJ/RimL family protein N-acetyltransferase
MLGAIASSLRIRNRPACPAADVYSDIDARDRIANEPVCDGTCSTISQSLPAFIRAVLAQSVSDFEEHLFGIWTVREKGVDAPIGFCGLRLVQDLGEVEVLYTLTDSKWKHGFAFEAASSIIHYAFELAGLNQIVGITDVPNVSSWRVLEQLGMREFRPPTAQHHLRYARC